MSYEGMARKARSEAQLRQKGVPFIDWLPHLQDETETKLPPLEKVAYRAMCLSMVAVRAEGLEKERVQEISREYGLGRRFSPAERKFLSQGEPSEHNKIQFIWRYEAYNVLLWALNYLPELPYPDAICDVPAVVTIMQERTSEEFIGQARLRSLTEVLDATDLHFRYHWATRNAELTGQAMPAHLEPGVVMERHYALNWLAGQWRTAGWDRVDIST